MSALMADQLDAFVDERKAGLSYPAIAIRHGTTAQVVRYHVKRAVKAGRVTAAEVYWNEREATVPALSKTDYDERWIKRVVARVQIAENGCWIWPGQKTSGMGYGQTSYRNKNISIHRYMYQITHKVELAREQYVCHTCDTPACCNPAHLELGDHTYNQRSCVEKGRNYEARRTECERGHPFDEQNTRYGLGPRGTPKRTCKTCERMRVNSPEYKAKAAERQRRRRAQMQERV